MVKELYHQLVEEQNRDEINDNNSNKIFLNDEISISNLSFGYPDAKFDIIKNFNCEIKKNLLCFLWEKVVRVKAL